MLHFFKFLFMREPGHSKHTELSLPSSSNQRSVIGMTMDFSQISYYRINMRLLYYLGQWPLQSPIERYLYRTTTIIFVCSIVIPKLIKFVQCLGDLHGMILCLPVLGIHARSAARFLNCSINANKMKSLTTRIQEDWNPSHANLEGTILKRYAERGRLLTIIYTAYMSLALGMYLSLPIIPTILDIVSPLNQSRDRIYLYETEYFIDRDANYIYLMIHACITMPFSVGMIVAYDTMFAVYVHHACAIFATLGSRLESVGCINYSGDRLKTNNDSIKHRDETYDDIVSCIKIHKEAVEFTALLESSGYICYFFVVGIDMLAMTLTGFMTVTNLDQPGEALRHGAFAIGEIVHLFYVCWQGHVLMEHSQHIFINTYNINWYDISARAKKLLIVIMMRSAEPCKLTAGKIYVLSMENFATALKTSMSYFTVLLSMQ